LQRLRQNWSPPPKPRALVRFRSGALVLLDLADLGASDWSATISAVKIREIIELLEADRWFLATTRGSHRQFKHPTKAGRVTVAGKLSDDLHPKTRASILRQAGLRQ
jgi:predicted RNA binding protein YcfA (HicA-like mRNA interferase family)